MMLRSTTLLFLITALCSSANVVVATTNDEPSSQSSLRQRQRHRQVQKDVGIGESRIVGGSAATPGEYPFYTKWDGCGASLVAPDVVLTAAHCQGISDSRVYVGRSSNQYFNNPNPGTERRIVQRVPHPQYRDGASINYDYMLLKLNQPVDTIQPVRLNRSPNLPQNNQPLTVVGFGTTSSGSSSTPRDLLEVAVNYIPTSTCNGPQYGYRGEVLDPTMFCAGVGGGKDSCQGDSGGPIFTQDGNGGFTQFGIVSWGIGCAERLYPGVYSRISAELEWIESKICEMTTANVDFCNNGGGGGGGVTIPITTNEPTRPPTAAPTTASTTAAATRPPTAAPTAASTTAAAPAGTTEVRLEITYDQFIEETGWYFSQGGSIVAEIPTGSIEEQGSWLYRIYLVGGQPASFTITDAFGDGSCCDYGNGGYRIVGPAGEVLADSEGLYGLGETKRFIVPTSSGNSGNTTPQATRPPTQPPTLAPRTPSPTARPATPSPTGSSGGGGGGDGVANWFCLNWGWFC
eukprot:CAMPEP_0194200450 /NCGR_PEP_ID=MMETSP0156-20130528/1047_1 /TAXON_ID=33649 /ORGANISM="Thalassionema nitzschioides, Strain L26-B" /LENGTH=516 /DNA_ID=CAMNT_0038925445 /DNA_START=43 /DNA_END=1596 /DNA_ORIENTATION=-